MPLEGCPSFETLLLHQQINGPEGSNLHANTVARSDPPPAVREGHPVRHALDGGAALAQFPHVLHFWDYQLHSGLRIVKCGLCLLIIERCSFSRIHHAVAEANHLARLRVLYFRRIDSPEALIIHSLLHRNVTRQVSLPNPRHGFRRGGGLSRWSSCLGSLSGQIVTGPEN